MQISYTVAEWFSKWGLGTPRGPWGGSSVSPAKRRIIYFHCNSIHTMTGSMFSLVYVSVLGFGTWKSLGTTAEADCKSVHTKGLEVPSHLGGARVKPDVFLFRPLSHCDCKAPPHLHPQAQASWRSPLDDACFEMPNETSRGITEIMSMCEVAQLQRLVLKRGGGKKVEINYNSRSTYSLFLELLAGSHRPHQWNEFPQLPSKCMLERCMMFFHADLEVELDNSVSTWETKTNSICWWRWDEVKSKSTLNQYYFAICYFQGQE